MRISIGQIVILILISLLLFGDLKSLKKKIASILKKINTFFK